jgi:hypothetical protein
MHSFSGNQGRSSQRLILSLITLATLALAAPVRVSAQDAPEGQKNRKGFVLDLGLGVSRVRYTVTGATGSGSKTAIGTDFMIGHAPSNQLMIYYSNVANFYSFDDSFNGETYVEALGMSGVGATWFFKPTQPSFFVNGAIGIAALRSISTEDSSTDGISGVGVTVGGGYEFARHFLLDAKLLVTRLEDDLNGSALRVGLTWLLY